MSEQLTRQLAEGDNVLRACRMIAIAGGRDLRVKPGETTGV